MDISRFLSCLLEVERKPTSVQQAMLVLLTSLKTGTGRTPHVPFDNIPQCRSHRFQHLVPSLITIANQIAAVQVEPKACCDQTAVTRRRLARPGNWELSGHIATIPVKYSSLSKASPVTQALSQSDRCNAAALGALGGGVVAIAAAAAAIPVIPRQGGRRER